MDDSQILPNFNLDIFSDLITDHDITDISDDIIDEELITCVESIGKEQKSVTNPPDILTSKIEKSKNAHFALLTDENRTTIINSAEAKGTKKNTKSIVSTIEGKYICKSSSFSDERTV